MTNFAFFSLPEAVGLSFNEAAKVLSEDSAVKIFDSRNLEDNKEAYYKGLIFVESSWEKIGDVQKKLPGWNCQRVAGPP